MRSEYYMPVMNTHGVFVFYIKIILTLNLSTVSVTSPDGLTKSQFFSLQKDTVCSGSSFGVHMVTTALACHGTCLDNVCAGVNYKNGICTTYSCTDAQMTAGVGSICYKVAGGRNRYCGEK